MIAKKSFIADSAKARTGIDGFDEITNGGLPAGRTTLLEGGPGSGKTIMALQCLVNGARLDQEPAIFIAFEENSERIVSNAAKFGWDLPALQTKKLFFLDAQPTPELFPSGSFDLCGMLAILEAKVKEMGAKRIVIDAIDLILALLGDPVAERREVYRLHEWLLANGLTAIITSKSDESAEERGSRPQLGFMQFMVDCAVLLNHQVSEGISQRNLRVVKYRGSSFSENESPFLIGNQGLEVAGGHQIGDPEAARSKVPTDRVSTGIRPLDVMLGGGYYREASILITGFPGTAKSTLSGAFAEAACQRGERTLFISFDTDANEVVRNLTSVHIRLERFVKKGLLRLVSARTVAGNAEIHLMQIKKLAKEHGAQCMIIDPVSALLKTGDENTSARVAERLIDWTKSAGITLLSTSLLHEAGAQVEGTPLQISTIADTWIHLSYLVLAGERNRGLSIIKSRGTAHSNQVRELILSSEGVTLADVYSAGGEVLMGTLRWEKENAVRAARQETHLAAKLKQANLSNEEALLEVRLKAAQLELEVKRAEKKALAEAANKLTFEINSGHTHLRELRGTDKK